MKKITKMIVSSVLAFAMVIGMFSSMFSPAKVSAEGNGTKKVTLHKLLLKTKDELDKWDSEKVKKGGYNGTQDLNQLNQILSKIGGGHPDSVKEIPGVYFAWQKKNDAGEWKYIKSDGSDATGLDDPNILGGLTTATGKDFDVTKLPAGEYQIVEIREKSTYVGKGGETLTSQKAVPVLITLPLVKEDGVIENAHVYPKNVQEKPQVDKNLEGKTDYNKADQQKGNVNKMIGDEVPYEVKTKLPKDAKYKTLRWEDTMTKGLTYKKGLELTVKVLDPAEDVTLTSGTDYELTENGSGFVLNFKADGLKKIEDATKKGEVEFILKYKAILNGEAVVDTPDKNQVKFDYDNKVREFKDPRENEVTPKDNSIEVTKSWAEGNAPAGVTVTYYLYEKGATAGDDKVVDSVTKKDNFNHKFTGLDASKTYYVKEIVAGYTPEYKTEAGKVTVKNTKTPDSPVPVIPTSPEVVTYGKKFVKTGENGTDRLAGAEFVVENADGKFLGLKDSATVKADRDAYAEAQKKYDEAIKAYNDLETNKQQGQEGTEAKEKIEKAKVIRDKAFLKVRTDYEWTTEEKAVKFTSNKDGQFEVAGLLAGNYKLKEVRAPEGYALLSGKIDFEVNANSYSSAGDINYSQDQAGKTDATKVINKKVTIPQTGGVGTVIFTVIGITLMGVAVYAMKRRNAEEK
ncbi:pilin N-terminal domain-containing protein [uncultured Parvimonas sp.]|uniref:pilin N-terminal domain-containing protein n=1 Tax=uncultured Parvimonas sp. TaxID=747372 RepID=UPI0028D62DE3|nr:SpaA isopeptide-forming pilin-related protein [uncultured Parvimonas sp.]